MPIIPGSVDRAVSWTVPVLGAGWTNLGLGWQTARYAILNGIVVMEGLIQNTSGGPLATALFTLPAGFRPTATIIRTEFSIPLEVRLDGVVIPNAAVADTAFIGIGVTFAPG
jgi:hypothetical protein